MKLWWCVLMGWGLSAFSFSPNDAKLPMNLSDTKTKTANCADVDFDLVVWPELIRVEPRLETHLQLMAEGSKQLGAELDINNCQVVHPVDANNRMADGQWNVVMDHTWITQEKNGNAVTNQAGLRVVFIRNAKRTTQPREVPFKLYLRGVSYCWGPDGCAAMGIPYAAEQKN